jgi:hypothetical protein
MCGIWLLQINYNSETKTLSHDQLRDSLPLGLRVLAKSDWGRGRGRVSVGLGGERRATMMAEPGAVRAVARGSGASLAVLTVAATPRVKIRDWSCR